MSKHLWQDIEQISMTWDQDDHWDKPCGPFPSQPAAGHSTGEETSPLSPMFNASNLKRLLDTMAQAVLALDCGGRVFVWNPACEKLFGTRKHGALRQNVRALLPAGALLQRVFDTVTEGREVSNLELSLVIGGKEKVLFLDTRRLQDHSRRLSGALCVITDVTRMRKQEKQLQRHEQVLLAGKIIAGFAHEVRNPLTAVRGFAQMLLEESPALKPPEHYLRLIIEEVDRVNELIRGFISLGHDQPKERETVEVGELVSGTVRLIQGYALSNGINVEVVPAPSPAYVHVHKEQVKQVLLDLLKNVMEAGAPGGPISIRTDVTEKTVLITVTSSSADIHPEELNQVLNNIVTDRGGGLGLPVSRGILERHGGDIQVKSLPEGGTVATVTLPTAGRPDPLENHENTGQLFSA